ncbi:hypothetical protein BKA82DRAFT_1001811, partial [Pisolithus tinctorius]
LSVSSPTLSSVPPPSSDLEATLGECIARHLSHAEEQGSVFVIPPCPVLTY